MVEPLRKRTFSANNESLLTGMYVVESSNAKDLVIPHLPVIDKASINNGLWSSGVTSGDVVYYNQSTNRMRTILTSNSNENTLLVTEQCENRCLFCSQPPNERDDIELYKNATLALLNFNAESVIGITGGEPTTNKKAFLTLLHQLDYFNNKTKLHILSHGRNLSDINFVEDIQKCIGSREISWGIPLYGHKSSLHNRLVNAQKAFDETLQGIVNLSAFGQVVEARIVPVTHNIHHLINIINFLVNSFQNIKQISIMNLEPIGWAKKNYLELFVPVGKQNVYLNEVINICLAYGVSIQLYNYPLCLLNDNLRAFSVRSISDWKNYYPSGCNQCARQQVCGGFFTSSTGKYLEDVEPFQ